MTPTYTSTSPAAALRRHWLKQQTDADRQILEQFLEYALANSNLLRHSIPTTAADSEVKAFVGVPDKASNINAMEAIYQHEPALPYFAYAVALALDACHCGEESPDSWAARIPEGDRYDFESDVDDALVSNDIETYSDQP